MKRNARSLAGLLLPLAVVLGLVALRCHSIRPPGEATSGGNNNPQKFSLWATGKAFTYTFTVDPRAVDVWMFTHAGGGANLQTVSASWQVAAGPAGQGNIHVLTIDSDEPTNGIK